MKYLPDWINSVRSLSTVMVIVTFCYMAARGKIEAKDFLLIVSAICNFYFLVKKHDDKPEVK